MSTVYLVTNTANTKTITIQPKTTNGPSGVLSDTDINLHGPGAIKWGSRLDENFIRLTENFACPESVVTPGKPKTSIELQSPSHGINNPLEGQLWFNTTRKRLMNFDGTNWNGVGTPPTQQPTNPGLGDLWFDKTHYTVGTANGAGLGQLMIFDTNGWQRVDKQLLNTITTNYMRKSGTIMTGTLVLSGDPTAANHAATKNYVDATVAAAVMNGLGGLSYMPMSGGLMTDSTIPNEPWNHIQFDNGQNKVVSRSWSNGTTQAELGLWTGVDRAATGDVHHDQYGSSKIFLMSGTYANRRNGGVYIQVADNTTNTTGSAITWHDFGFFSDSLSLGSKRLTNVADPFVATDGVNVQYADSHYAKVFTSTPSYADSKPGAIWTEAGKVFIAISQGNWRQIFPAVYS